MKGDYYKKTTMRDCSAGFPLSIERIVTITTGIFSLVFLLLTPLPPPCPQVPLYKHFGDLAGNSKFVLPVPSFNVINGGKHAGNKLAFQVKQTRQ